MPLLERPPGFLNCFILLSRSKISQLSSIINTSASEKLASKTALSMFTPLTQVFILLLLIFTNPRQGLAGFRQGLFSNPAMLKRNVGKRFNICGRVGRVLLVF